MTTDKTLADLALDLRIPSDAAPLLADVPLATHFRDDVRPEMLHMPPQRRLIKYINTDPKLASVIHKYVKP